MRGLVAVSFTLAIAALSGCVELVEGEDPDVDAAAAEADRLLDEYNDKAGHIAGTVLGADGGLLEGATVDLLTVQSARTDEAGRFSFVDLTPGLYTVIVNAADHLETRTDVEVAAGQFARPEVTLQALPSPEPYFTVFRFEGYADPAMTPFGFFGCYSCSVEGDLDPEGLTEIVLEAEMGPTQDPFLPPSSSFAWMLDVWNDEEGSSTDGYEASPMHVHVLAEEFVEAPTQFYLGIEPQADFIVSGGQQFTSYLTAFYHQSAPEDYTAFQLEDEP